MSKGLLSLGPRFARSRGPATSVFLPEAFAGFDELDCINVLDIGAGRGRTLDAIKGYRCRIFFLDLYEDYLQERGDTRPTEQTAHSAFERILSEHSGALFDVCLFWDFLNLLTLPELRGLSEALQPYTYSGTKAHGVCALLPYGPEANCDYKIQQLNQLEIVPGPSRSYHSWSYADFAVNFDCLNLHCDSISAEGRLEYLLVNH